VHPESSKAKFETDKRKLHVTMKPVSEKNKFALCRSSSDESDVFEELEANCEETSDPKTTPEEKKKATEKETLIQFYFGNISERYLNYF